MLEVKKFYGTWCGPCKLLTPIIDDLKNKYDNVKFTDVDVDVNIELTDEFKIRGVPTVLFLKDGEVVERIVGFKQKEVYTELLNKYGQVEG